MSTDGILQADDNFIDTSRTRPNFSQNSVPSIIPGCPSYYSSDLPKTTQFLRVTKDEEHFALAIRLSLGQQESDTRNLPYAVSLSSLVSTFVK